MLVLVRPELQGTAVLTLCEGVLGVGGSPKRSVHIDYVLVLVRDARRGLWTMFARAEVASSHVPATTTIP